MKTYQAVRSKKYCKLPVFMIFFLISIWITKCNEPSKFEQQMIKPECQLIPEKENLEMGGTTKIKMKVLGDVENASFEGQSINKNGGEIEVTPTENMTYNGIVKGYFGTKTCTTKINLLPESTCTLSASSKKLVEGESSIIKMKTTGEINKASFNGLPIKNGQEITINPTENTTYEGFIETAFGRKTCSIDIEVIPDAQCTLTATPSEILLGDHVNLKMQTQSDGPIETALLNGNKIDVNGGNIIIEPTNGTTYQGEITGEFGKRTCQAIVTLVNEPTCQMTAEPSQIFEGETSTINIEINGKVDDARLGEENINTSGDLKMVSPPTTTSYITTIKSKWGEKTCKIDVTVRPKPNVDGRISGEVSSALENDAPIADVTVRIKESRFASYINNLQTNQQGEYDTGLIPPGIYYLDFIKDGYISTLNQEVIISPSQEVRKNISLSPIMENEEYRIVLNWTSYKIGAVRDVDSYLLIPGVEEPLFYRKVRRNYYGAYLDVDDTTWSGPETITLGYNEARLRVGTYKYYVHNYSETDLNQALGKSEIVINVYKGQNHLKSYMIREGTGMIFEFFWLVVSENGQVEIIDIMEYNDSLPEAYKIDGADSWYIWY